MKKIDNQNSFSDFEKMFWKLSREMGHLWRKVYEKTFPGSQSHILFILERNGPKNMSELADALHLTPGAVTTASDQLIKQGHIARQRDETDRRVVHLKLTEKGRKTLKTLQEKGQKVMRIVFNDITDTDLELLNTIFKQATINIDTIGKEFD